MEASEDTATSGSQEVSPASGPTLPILQKIVDLSNKIKVLISLFSSGITRLHHFLLNYNSKEYKSEVVSKLKCL